MGANTVNGPCDFSASIKSASLKAVAKVLNEPAAIAVSTMSFSTAALLL